MKKLEKKVETSLRGLDDDFRNKTFLLALSGGSDSVCLFHVFKALDIKFEVAHCNFNLRGKESNGDQKFVHNLIKSNSIKGSFIGFQTKEFALENKLSIQDAARKLRYDWFYQLIDEKNIDYIVTAHHQDDLIETSFINLTRGTGIKGLKGIPLKNEKVIRPMLGASKLEINSYLESLKIEYRNDSSNDNVKYSRNFLRHKILPELDNVHQNAKKGILNTLSNLSSIDEYLSEKLKEDCGKYLKIGEVIELQRIDLHSFYFIYYVLSKYGFTKTQVENIIHNSQKGAVFNSSEYRLIKEESSLFIKKNLPHKKTSYTFNKEGVYQDPFSFTIENYNGSNELINFSDSVAWFDACKVEFPFILRKWKEGDVFQPLGMNGKKKLSDFFTDLKLNQFEKEDVWVIESNDKICWIVGKRLSNHVKITPKTTKIIKIVTNL